MNIYEKINKLRMDFLSKEVKKTGYNSFSKFYFFELKDILPVALPLCKELGITTITGFEKNDFGIHAKMIVVNTEKTDETIELFSAAGTADLKACHDIQNVGAVETYHRRYLWTALLELTEHDEIDLTSGIEEPEDEKKQTTKKQKPEIKTPPVTATAKTEAPKTETKPEPAPAKEEPKPADSVDATKNYRIHFMKELNKTGQLNDAMNYIRKTYGEVSTFTVAKMKQILAEMMAFKPDAGITID
ncbi:MAG TPA: ERF family protein [bacterium]|nr:ERF family protein [bacterium]